QLGTRVVAVLRPDDAAGTRPAVDRDRADVDEAPDARPDRRVEERVRAGDVHAPEAVAGAVAEMRRAMDDHLIATERGPERRGVALEVDQHGAPARRQGRVRARYEAKHARAARGEPLRDRPPEVSRRSGDEDRHARCFSGMTTPGRAMPLRSSRPVRT